MPFRLHLHVFFHALSLFSCLIYITYKYIFLLVSLLHKPLLDRLFLKKFLVCLFVYIYTFSFTHLSSLALYILPINSSHTTVSFLLSPFSDLLYPFRFFPSHSFCSSPFPHYLYSLNLFPFTFSHALQHSPLLFFRLFTSLSFPIFTAYTLLTLVLTSFHLTFTFAFYSVLILFLFSSLSYS